MIKPEIVIVFDLDDTLYLERDFVASGYAAVGAWIAERHGIDDFAERAASVFEAGERGRVFDAVLSGLGFDDHAALVAELVAVYRGHRPTISLAPDAAAWLDRQRPGCGVALLTDGAPRTQATKLTALGLDRRGLDPIVRTGEWGRSYWKPHPRGFEQIQLHHDLPAAKFVYVADNCAKDFIAPRALGWRTVQIRRPGAIHAASAARAELLADAVITSLDELDDVIARTPVRLDAAGY